MAKVLIVNWEALRPHLDFTYAEEKAIQKLPGYESQKIEFLRQLIEKKGDKATYAALISAAVAAGDQQLAHNLEKMTVP